MLVHPPRPDGAPAAVLHHDRERTAAGLAEHDPRDGEAWLRLCEQWDRIAEPLLRTLFTPFPPVRGPVALLRRIGTAEALRLARFLLLPARRMGQELFASEGARLLLAGNAVHADAPPDAPASGVYGWLLAMLGQQLRVPDAGRRQRRAGRGAGPPGHRRREPRSSPDSTWSGSR